MQRKRRRNVMKIKNQCQEQSTEGNGGCGVSEQESSDEIESQPTTDHEKNTYHVRP